jgi:hypothetical protein
MLPERQSENESTLGKVMNCTARGEQVQECGRKRLQERKRFQEPLLRPEKVPGTFFAHRLKLWNSLPITCTAWSMASGGGMGTLR